MRVLYGVVGEGMGHAIRSQVVIEHLVDEGHEVLILASQRAADYLRARFRAVHKIHGLHIITQDNEVRRFRTLWSNVRQGTAALPGQVLSYFDLIEERRPQAVISDFESFAYLYAQAHRIPVFSIDNMQIINRAVHPKAVLRGEMTNFRIARAVVRGKVPFCHHYFVTTFFYPVVRSPRTSLHPPVLRPRILEAEASKGEHLLVYQTAEGNRELADALEATGLPCRVYGMRRDLTEDVVEGSLCYRPFHEDRFIEDLASARAVVTGGGFTVICEAIYLHKPVLSTPIRGQFEQVLNARYVEREGYGLEAREVDRATIARFLDGLPRFEEALAGYAQDGNQDLLRALDEKLDQAAAGLFRRLPRVAWSSDGDEDDDDELDDGEEPLDDDASGGTS
ncbi:MAG: MJ1255/VC2487 family glycosyltransferase [Sandaracinaceae bacterium]